MQLTVMSHAPSSCPSWRVRLIKRGLGGGIGLDAGEADREPGTARDVDDAPAARGLHPRRHRLTQIERAADVDGEDRVPVAGVTASSGLPTCPSTPPALFTRISTRPRDRLTSSTSACTASRCVTSTVRTSQRPPARCTGARCPRVRRDDVDRPDMRAAFGERHADGASEAMGGAGDDRGLAGEVRRSCCAAHACVDQDLEGREGHRPPALLDVVDRVRRDVESPACRTPASRPSSAIVPICGSTSVLRLRTARSR